MMCKNQNLTSNKDRYPFVNLGKTVIYITDVDITKTSPCNEHPLTPHFYIVKLGFTGVYIFFLFLLQNIDCGYSLEPPH